MTRTQTMTQEQVDAVGRCQKLLPKESDIIAALGTKGHKRKYRPDGSYEWKHEYPTNVQGKLTKQASAVLEMLRPHSKADTERHLNNQARLPRVALRNKNGGVDYIDPALADSVAGRTGRTHVWKARGSRVERGLDGMLFKDAAGWCPLGRWCVGTPFTQSHRSAGGRKDGSMVGRGIQRDPDGVPWVWADGEWRS